MTDLTQDYLKKYFEYDPETGEFHRTLLRDRWGNESPTRRKIGTLGKKGYLEASVGGGVHKVHRLIFMYVEGKWPNHVDHINGERSDNRWCNLRSVTRQENMMNKGIGRNNTSGVMGVSWCEQFGKWRARVSVNGKRVSLGLFTTVEDAIEARKAAESDVGYHSNHGGRQAWVG